MFTTTELISLYVIALDKVEFDENEAAELKGKLYQMLIKAASATNEDLPYGEQSI